MATARPPRDQGIDLAEAEAFSLGTARVCPSLLRIVADGRTVSVDRRVMQMLVVLHAAAGATVTKQQLIAECWSGLAVSDDAITQCVSRLRRALPGAAGARVETVARIGYRLDTAEPEPARLLMGLSRRALLAGGAAATALTGAGAWFFLNSAPPAGDSIVVLPFANLSGDAGQAYLADGIAEEVRTAVARIGGIKVIGRTSSEALRGHEAVDAARRLGVGNVLTGSVRRSATAVRVSAELVNGRTGVVRWARSYDLALGDALQLETEIAQNVAEALELQLGSAVLRAIAQGGTKNAEALDLYIQARNVLRTSDTLPAIRQVLSLCDAAIALDPAFAGALALKALALATFGGNLSADAGQMRRAFAEAEAYARRAIAIAPQMAGGYVALARSFSGRLRPRDAFAEYRRAERLAPNDPLLLSLLSRSLSQNGSTASALSVAARLISVDPLNALAHGAKGFAIFFGRDFHGAIEAFRPALRIAPDMTEFRNIVGDCFCLLGLYPQALATYAMTPEDDMYRLSGEAFVAARTGRTAAVDSALARLERVSGDASSYQRAQILAQRGDHDGAFAMLERARNALDPGLNSLPADPFVDPLRHHPRFKTLVATLSLP